MLNSVNLAGMGAPQNIQKSPAGGKYQRLITGNAVVNGLTVSFREPVVHIAGFKFYFQNEMRSIRVNVVCFFNPGAFTRCQAVYCSA